MWNAVFLGTKTQRFLAIQLPALNSANIYWATNTRGALLGCTVHTPILNNSEMTLLLMLTKIAASIPKYINS